MVTASASGGPLLRRPPSPLMELTTRPTDGAEGIARRAVPGPTVVTKGAGLSAIATEGHRQQLRALPDGVPSRLLPPFVDGQPSAGALRMDGNALQCSQAQQPAERRRLCTLWQPSWVIRCLK